MTWGDDKQRIRVLDHLPSPVARMDCQFYVVWRTHWDEEAIALYVDDVLLNKTELNKLVNKDGSNSNPFKQPHYMLLDLALGGMNGGDFGDTKFPNRFEIDYVRVYQKK